MILPDCRDEHDNIGELAPRLVVNWLYAKTL